MSPQTPKISLVFDRRKKASSTQKATIEIRVTYSYRQVYLSTGISVYKEQWKNGHIENTNEDLLLNNILDKKVSEVRRLLLDMMSDKSFDIISLTQRYKMQHLTFIDFCKKRIAVRAYGKSPTCQRRYNRFLEFFTQWGRIKYFEDVSDINIIAYDRFLKSTGMKPCSIWSNYHKHLNSFILDAINEGYLTRNPYKWVNISKDKNPQGIKRHLTPEEFRRIKEAELPVRLDKVRDLFIFQTYTCLSYVDLATFDANAIKTIEGMPVYVGNRQKTHKTYTIPLLSPVLKILEKYDYILPLISNVKYNAYLKEVAEAVNINKPVSTHWARHTGATLLLNEGVDIKIVSKICGHSSIRITEQIYAKLLDETVVKAVKDLKI